MNSALRVSARAGAALARSPSLQWQQLSKRLMSTRELDRLQGDRERVVILGSGWAGYNLARELDPKKFQAVLVSPRPYFVFTPLLASTSVGTLEFRTVLESVRGRKSHTQYFQGRAESLDFDEKRVVVRAATKDTISAALPTGGSSTAKDKGQTFELTYDKLVVAVGCHSQTFNTPGVREHAFFLKDVGDARKIRKRILQCFSMAALPSATTEQKESMLNFAIVGGGPTGVEFAAELYDLVHQDLSRTYPELLQYVKISIYDVAPKILPMFAKSLSSYAVDKFKRDGIQVRTEHHIENLRPGYPGSTDPIVESNDNTDCFTLKTKQDGEIAVGMCIWSTGLMMNPFIQQTIRSLHKYPASSASLRGTPPSPPEEMQWSIRRHPRSGRLFVDNKFRVQLDGVQEGAAPESSTTRLVLKDVFALGDVATTEQTQLPATAQVANQEAKWLSKRFNKGDLEGQHFQFNNLGVMTYLGGMSAILQTDKAADMKGIGAWLVWRGAYLTRTISWRNRLLIPMYWLINAIFGRDISRF